jgi:hypothetical protein
MMVSLLLRFFHILSAALWMGSALFWPSALRRALALGPPHASAALDQARTGLGLDLGAGIATVLFGLIYASPIGHVPMRAGIGIGLVLALARLVLLFVLGKPAIRGVAEAVGRGDVEAARMAAKRLPAYAGSAHLLWLLALIAMVFPI